MVNGRFFNRPDSKELSNTTMIEITLEYELNQVKECLESEGVSISKVDIIKAIDVYCRLVGIANPSMSKDEPLKGLRFIVGLISANDVKIEGDLKESIKNAFIAYNEKADEDRKFDDINTVSLNVQIIFKEISIFFSEILLKAYLLKTNGEFFDKAPVITYVAVAGNCVISITAAEEAEKHVVVYIVESNALSKTRPEKPWIVENTIDGDAEE